MTVIAPVFCVMLTGSFAEATRALDENDSLVLGDDEGLASIDFCKFAHHRPLDSLKQLTLDRAAGIALVVDKYRCAGNIILPLLTLFVGL